MYMNTYINNYKVLTIKEDREAQSFLLTEGHLYVCMNFYSLFITLTYKYISIKTLIILQLALIKANCFEKRLKTYNSL